MSIRDQYVQELKNNVNKTEQDSLHSIREFIELKQYKISFLVCLIYTSR